MQDSLTWLHIIFNEVMMLQNMHFLALNTVRLSLQLTGLTFPLHPLTSHSARAMVIVEVQVPDIILTHQNSPACEKSGSQGQYKLSDWIINLSLYGEKDHLLGEGMKDHLFLFACEVSYRFHWKESGTL